MKPGSDEVATASPSQSPYLTRSVSRLSTNSPYTSDGDAVHRETCTKSSSEDATEVVLCRDASHPVRRKRKRTISERRCSNEPRYKVRRRGCNKQFAFFDITHYEDKVTELPRDVLISVLEHFLNLRSSDKEDNSVQPEDHEDDRTLSVLLDADDLGEKIHEDDDETPLPAAEQSTLFSIANPALCPSDIDSQQDTEAPACKSRLVGEMSDYTSVLSAADSDAVESQMLSVMRHRAARRKRRHTAGHGASKSVLKGPSLSRLEPGWPHNSRCPLPGTASLWCRLRVCEAAVFAMCAESESCASHSLSELTEALQALLLVFPYTVRLVWQLALCVCRVLLSDATTAAEGARLVGQLVPMFVRLPDVEPSSVVNGAHSLLLAAGHTHEALAVAQVVSPRLPLALRGARLFNAFQQEVVRCQARALTAQDELACRALTAALSARLEVGCVGALAASLAAVLEWCRQQPAHDTCQ